MSKKQKVTEIICVIDKSGSMDIVKDDVIGGFNAFIEEQKKLKDFANLTLTLFDTNYKIISKSKDIKTIDKLNSRTYCPGGCTALLDAVGKSVDDKQYILYATKYEEIYLYRKNEDDVLIENFPLNKLFRIFDGEYKDIFNKIERKNSNDKK